MTRFHSWLAIWIMGARPRTLGAAVMPVLVGTAIAFNVQGNEESISWIRFALGMTVAVTIQIGVNYANDYSDGKRGTDDTALRKGPTRLVGSGQKSPKAVLWAALIFFALSAVSGLILAVLVGWELILVGVAALFAAWTYTGGPWPYGYRALGEVSVLIFFGLVPTAGSAYIQIEEFPSSVWLIGIGIGLMSAAILIANNFRDIQSDRAVGKVTLAVLLGHKGTLFFYLSVVVVASGLVVINHIAGSSQGLLTLLAIIGPAFCVLPSRDVPKTESHIWFVPKLSRSVVGLYIYGFGLCLGL